VSVYKAVEEAQAKEMHKKMDEEVVARLRAQFSSD